MDKSEQGHEMRWTVHLARKEPGKATFVIVISVLAGIVAAVMMRNGIMFLLGFLIVIGATADFLLPIRCHVGAAGAKVRVAFSTSAIGWDRVRRVVEGDDGVKLSPLEKRSRLAPFRGVYLRADGNKQEILDCISYWRQKYAASLGKATDGGTERRTDPESGNGD